MKLFIVPILIDCITCFLALRSNRIPESPSGLPVVTLFIYGLIILYIPTIGTSEKLLYAMYAVAFHILIVFILPYLDQKNMNKNNQ